MMQFAESLLSDILGNLIFAIILILFGWLIYALTKRRKLLKFFKIEKTKRLVIYLSRLNITSGGALDPHGVPRSYAGPTNVYNEQLVANKFRDNFNFLIPKLSEKPGILGKILFADISVHTVLSGTNYNEIDGATSIISLGSPGYNLVSEYIQNHVKCNAHFAQNGGSINILNLPTISDPENGFVQRIVDNSNGRSIFYVAGLSERGTIGAAAYLADHWNALFNKYGHYKSFLIMLRFTTGNVNNFTIDWERTIE